MIPLSTEPGCLEPNLACQLCFEKQDFRNSFTYTIPPSVHSTFQTSIFTQSPSSFTSVQLQLESRDRTVPNIVLLLLSSELQEVDSTKRHTFFQMVVAHPIELMLANSMNDFWNTPSLSLSPDHLVVLDQRLKYPCSLQLCLAHIGTKYDAYSSLVLSILHTLMVACGEIETVVS